MDNVTPTAADEMPNWKTELQKIDPLPQRQDSTTDQLNDLIIIANKFGFYDAADYLKHRTTPASK